MKLTWTKGNVRQSGPIGLVRVGMLGLLLANLMMACWMSKPMKLMAGQGALEEEC